MSKEYEEMNVEKWVNLEDVAVHLSLSQDTVRTWIKEGALGVFQEVCWNQSKTLRPTFDATIKDLMQSR